MATKPVVVRDLLCAAPRPLTFGVDPVRVSVGQCRAVAQLLNSLRGFVVDLEDAARPSPTGRVCFRHFVHTPPTRRIGPRVVGDGPLQEDWGRQLAGVVGNCGKFAESSGRIDGRTIRTARAVLTGRGDRAERGWVLVVVGREGCGYRTDRAARSLYGASVEGDFRRWGTRTNWLSGLRNDIDLRKMATGENK